MAKKTIVDLFYYKGAMHKRLIKYKPYEINEDDNMIYEVEDVLHEDEMDEFK